MLKKGEKAITLIALVITIIVLLILAGVTIATLTGQNGILTNSTKAKNDTDLANAKEQVELALQALRTQNLGDITGVLPDDIIHELEQGGIKGAAVSTNTFPTKITMPGGIIVTVDDQLTIVEVAKGETGGGEQEKPGEVYPDESQWAPASEFQFDKSTGTIIKYLGTSNTVIIPEKIDGVEVKILTWDSMRNSDSSGPRNITIPATVTEIANGAFMEYYVVDLTCYAKAKDVNYYFVTDPNGPSVFYYGVMRFVNDDILVACNGYTGGEEYEDWQKVVYQLNKTDKTAEIIGLGDRHGSSTVYIKEKIEEYNITKIKTGAFSFLYNQTGNLEGVVIPATIKEIESQAIDGNCVRYLTVNGNTLEDIQKMKFASDFAYNINYTNMLNIRYKENGKNVSKEYATLTEFLNAVNP